MIVLALLPEDNCLTKVIGFFKRSWKKSRKVMEFWQVISVQTL